jgi:hypothetical protein
MQRDIGQMSGRTAVEGSRRSGIGPAAHRFVPKHPGPLKHTEPSAVSAARHRAEEVRVPRLATGWRVIQILHTRYTKQPASE